jgi:hypothetical protein
MALFLQPKKRHPSRRFPRACEGIIAPPAQSHLSAWCPRLHAGKEASVLIVLVVLSPTLLAGTPDCQTLLRPSNVKAALDPSTIRAPCLV